MNKIRKLLSLLLTLCMLLSLAPVSALAAEGDDVVLELENVGEGQDPPEIAEEPEALPDYASATSESGTRDVYAFTTQPLSGYIDPASLSYTINWDTNADLRTVYIFKYYEEATEYVYDPVTVLDGTVHEYTFDIDKLVDWDRYILKAAYGDGDGHFYSNPVTIDLSNLGFTLLPSGGQIDPDTLSYTVTWNTNFTPYDLEICHYIEGGGTPIVVDHNLFPPSYLHDGQYQYTFDIDALTSADNYFIRVYYHNTHYINSPSFSFDFSSLAFTTPPEGGVYDPLTKDFYISGATNFSFNKVEVCYYGEDDLIQIAQTYSPNVGESKRDFNIRIYNSLGEHAFFLRAYYKGDYYIESNSFKVSNQILYFTVQPESGYIVPETLSYTINWDTNVELRTIFIYRYYEGSTEYQYDPVTVLDGAVHEYTFNIDKLVDWDRYIIKATYGLVQEEGHFYSDPVTIDLSNLAFSLFPTGGQIDPDTLSYTVRWNTNFSPYNLEICHYNEGGVNPVVDKSLIPSLHLENGRYQYTFDIDELTSVDNHFIRVYYHRDHYINSPTFSVDFSPLAFTIYPTSSTYDAAGNFSVEWGTNFTPKRVELCGISDSGDVIVEKYDSLVLDKQGTLTGTGPLAEKEFFFRAYYSSDYYITTGRFTLTDVGYQFTTQPQSGQIDPDTLNYSVEWRISFQPRLIDILYDSGDPWHPEYSVLTTIDYNLSPALSHPFTSAEAGRQFFIRAWYGDGNSDYVLSSRFNVGTDLLVFTEDPYLLEYDPADGIYYVMWTTSFIPLRIVISHTVGDSMVNPVQDDILTSGYNTLGAYTATVPDGDDTYYFYAYYGTETGQYVMKSLRLWPGLFNFISAPESGSFLEGPANYPLEWTTSFVPVKVEILKEDAVIHTITQDLHQSDSYDLKAVYGEGVYRIRAFYSDSSTAFVDCVSFTVSFPGPMFTKQPADGPALKTVPYEASWSTSFTPLRLELWTYKDEVHEKVPGELVPTATAFAFTYSQAMQYLDKVFYLRAWYGEGEDEYKNSFNFKVSPRIQLGTSAVDLGVSAFVLPVEDGENYYTIYNNNYTDTSYLNYSFVTGSNRTVEVILEATNDYSVGDMYYPEYSKYALRYVLQGYTDQDGAAHQNQIYKSGFQTDPVFCGVKPGVIHFSISMAELRQQFAATGNPNPDIMDVHISVVFNGGNDYWDSYDWLIKDVHQTDPDFWFYPEINYENLTLTSVSFVPKLEFLNAENLEGVDLPGIASIKTDWYTVLAAYGSVMDEYENLLYGKDPYPQSFMNDYGEEVFWQSYFYDFSPDDSIDRRFAKYFGEGYNDWVTGPVNPAAAYGLGPANYKFGLVANHITKTADTIEGTAVSLSEFINEDNIEFYNSLVGLDRDKGYFTDWENVTGDMPWCEPLAMINCVITVTFDDGVTYRKDLAFTNGGESSDFRINGEPYSLPEISAVTIKSATVMFEGQIHLRFTYEIPQEVMDLPGAYVSFDQNGVETKILLTKGEASSSGIRFYYPVNIPDFADEIIVRMYDGNDNLLKVEKPNHDDFTNGFPYSVKQYAENKMETGSTEEMRALATALFDYGTAAQIYFKHGDYQELTVNDRVNAVTLDDLAPYIHIIESTKPDNGKPDGVSTVSLTAYFEANNTLQVAFTLDGTRDVSEYTFLVDGKVVQPVVLDTNKYGLWYENIAAPDLNIPHTFTITDGTDTYTFTASILTYARTSVVSGKPDRVNLGKAMYLYYYTAAAYFAG